MNKFLNKLERKIGKYAITNLSLYMIICYAIGYVLYIFGNIFTLKYHLSVSPFDLISLNPYEILNGQVWRIITWVLVPPSSPGLFTIIMLYFYYQIGNALERTWGAFRYNVYIFSGILFTVIGAFVLYGISLATAVSTPENAGITISLGFSTYFINLSIFLAFAATYPDTPIYLFFVLPIRMKWLAIVYALSVGYQFIEGTQSVKIAIVMSLLNFILFFLTTRDYRRINPKEIYRRQQFKKATQNTARNRNNTSGSGNFGGFSQSKNPSGISKHKCAICGRGDNDFPNLEFRFCSKCNGNYEYCSDHLFTHEHVK